VLILEDLPELRVAIENYMQLTACTAVRVDDPIRSCLRMEPHRILVGEVRGTSIVGYAVGTSGSETQHLLADMKQYADIAQHIGEQRNSVARAIPANIAMYDKLEKDVRAYAAVCTTLHGELTVYDGKYPAQHQSTENTLHNVDNEAKRAGLLLKQIEVARRLRPLEDAHQWTVWQRDMQLLLDQEKALD
jgi:hypothetical protein